MFFFRSQFRTALHDRPSRLPAQWRHRHYTTVPAQQGAGPAHFDPDPPEQPQPKNRHRHLRLHHPRRHRPIVPKRRPHGSHRRYLQHRMVACHKPDDETNRPDPVELRRRRTERRQLRVRFRDKNHSVLLIFPFQLVLRDVHEERSRQVAPNR